ncbi:MAG: DUF3536 domain-containing protein [Bacteroidota bacterium]
MNSNNKYICIHGHFYQPPRENAWLETVELQDSARPFHDWNERINFECYAPNTAARILDDEGTIRKIVNNYARISFNFGPTLLSWLASEDPSTYAAIQRADQLSQERYSGHGSALAQVYNHLIMPLANRRDKLTQTRWGIRDFESRFGRRPEGIWLAETAVDTETLEILADEGIVYTILAPRQARAFRRMGDTSWQDLPHDNSVDPRRPYHYALPSGQSIVLFFYDGQVAQEVAFKGLLNNGKAFAKRLIDCFDHNDTPQLAHIATDGESYGHHHRHGEMALADCLNYIEENGLATVTNYAEYLERFPPEYEIQIHEESSWSCVHGVERWRSNCGCNTGGNGGWTQAWREPLRQILDWLRDELIPIYEREAGRLLKDPWAARDDYIEVILDRGEKSALNFLERHARKTLSYEDQILVLRIMEMQRNAQLMFTSCGWFFDEISGIETDQILQYALRAIAYAQQVSGAELHEAFIDRLRAAPSNAYAHGAVSYEKNVIPSQLDLERAGMHYAAASLFSQNPKQLSLFNYLATSEQFEKLEAGQQKLVFGRSTIKSSITWSEKKFTFAVLYLGQQNIIGNISIGMDRQRYEEMCERLSTTFRSTDLGQVISQMQAYFGPKRYTIWHLFRDEKRKILLEITEQNLRLAEYNFEKIYNDNYQLMTGMLQSEIPVPKTYLEATRHVINRKLHQFFEEEHLNIRQLRHWARELRKWQVELEDEAAFQLAAGERIFYEIRLLAGAEVPLDHLNTLNSILEILQELRVRPEIWKSQNLYFSIMQERKNGKWVFSSQNWKDAFLQLGEHLKVRL